MGLTFTVITLCIIYYIINKYYPHYITWHINYGFIGLMPMPYGFYTLLRVVVFVCSLYFLFEVKIK